MYYLKSISGSQSFVVTDEIISQLKLTRTLEYLDPTSVQ